MAPKPLPTSARSALAVVALMDRPANVDDALAIMAGILPDPARRRRWFKERADNLRTSPARYAKRHGADRLFLATATALFETVLRLANLPGVTADHLAKARCEIRRRMAGADAPAAVLNEFDRLFPETRGTQ